MWKLIFISLILIIQKSYCLDCTSNINNDEFRLKKQIFCYGYDPNVRPVKNHSTTTIISTKLIIKSFDFNDDDSTITVNSWMVKKWKDEYLAWDPRDYSNIRSFDESPDLIWTPVLNLYNSRISYGIGSCHPTNCIIYADGVTNVACVDPCNFVGQCNADFTRWPFDIQNCTLNFGSWMNLGNEIDFSTNKTVIESKKSVTNSNWKLIQTSVRKVVSIYINKDGKTTRVPSLKYSIVVERHSSSRVVMVFAPALVFIIFNLLSVFINPDTWERPCLVTISIVTHFNFLLLLFWFIPYNGQDVPVVYLFYRDSLLITGILLIETLIMRRIWMFESVIPKAIEININKLRNAKITEIFIIKKINNDPEIEQDQQQDDATILVEEVKTISNRNAIWRCIVKLIDRLIFVALCLTYFIMILLLFPNGYLLKDTLTYET